MALYCGKQIYSGRTGSRFACRPCPKLKGHRGSHGRPSIRLMPTDSCIANDVKLGVYN
jgi:hypothetical protein